jgi:hypothetical protein
MTPRTKREYLRELVADKNWWSDRKLTDEERALGFLGWHERGYWDTFLRDERQEKMAIRYIEANPVKAKLCRTAEDWPFSSAPFRDEYRRPAIPGAQS